MSIEVDEINMRAIPTMTVQQYFVHMGDDPMACTQADFDARWQQFPDLTYLMVCGRRIGNIIETIRIERPHAD